MGTLSEGPARTIAAQTTSHISPISRCSATLVVGGATGCGSVPTGARRSADFLSGGGDSAESGGSAGSGWLAAITIPSFSTVSHGCSGGDSARRMHPTLHRLLGTHLQRGPETVSHRGVLGLQLCQLSVKITIALSGRLSLKPLSLFNSFALRLAQSLQILDRPHHLLDTSILRWSQHTQQLVPAAHASFWTRLQNKPANNGSAHSC